MAEIQEIPLPTSVSLSPCLCVSPSLSLSLSLSLSVSLSLSLSADVVAFRMHQCQSPRNSPETLRRPPTSPKTRQNSFEAEFGPSKPCNKPASKPEMGGLN